MQKLFSAKILAVRVNRRSYVSSGFVKKSGTVFPVHFYVENQSSGSKKEKGSDICPSERFFRDFSISNAAPLFVLFNAVRCCRELLQ